jgi:ankyrin repeat protein
MWIEPAVVKLLLERKANVNACDKKKQTALHHASVGGHVNVVRTLLEHKVRMQSCLHLARETWDEGRGKREEGQATRDEGTRDEGRRGEGRGTRGRGDEKQGTRDD